MDFNNIINQLETDNTHYLLEEKQLFDLFSEYELQLTVEQTETLKSINRISQSLIIIDRGQKSSYLDNDVIKNLIYKTYPKKQIYKIITNNYSLLFYNTFINNVNQNHSMLHGNKGRSTLYKNQNYNTLC